MSRVIARTVRPAASVLRIMSSNWPTSESRPSVMTPEAMGDFVVKMLRHFDVDRAHAIAPDVGTPAILFAAAKQPDLFESLVVGSAAMRPELVE